MKMGEDYEVRSAGRTVPGELDGDRVRRIVKESRQRAQLRAYEKAIGRETRATLDNRLAKAASDIAAVHLDDDLDSVRLAGLANKLAYAARRRTAMTRRDILLVEMEAAGLIGWRQPCDKCLATYADMPHGDEVGIKDADVIRACADAGHRPRFVFR